MSIYKNLIGKVKKQACFWLKTYQKNFTVGFFFVAGGGKKLRNTSFQKALEDAESAEMPIFEVPKIDPVQ